MADERNASPLSVHTVNLPLMETAAVLYYSENGGIYLMNSMKSC